MLHQFVPGSQVLGNFSRCLAVHVMSLLDFLIEMLPPTEGSMYFTLPPPTMSFSFQFGSPGCVSGGSLVLCSPNLFLLRCISYSSSFQLYSPFQLLSPFCCRLPGSYLLSASLPLAVIPSPEIPAPSPPHFCSFSCSSSLSSTSFSFSIHSLRMRHLSYSVLEFRTAPAPTSFLS